MNEIVDRVAEAIDRTPNLFVRVNKARLDGYVHEICTPNPDNEPVVIAACRDHGEAVAQQCMLQNRAFAHSAVDVVRQMLLSMLKTHETP